jgi:hypothetical protein
MKLTYKSAMKKLIRQLPVPKKTVLWPNQNGVVHINKPFLILLTPPNSGSSAIANFIGQAQGVNGLGWPEFGAGRAYEGQWLVPGLTGVDRWWSEKYVNWSSVSGTWGQRITQIERRRPVEYVLEKSPPNIVRYKALRQMLPNARFVINNREPFANIASQIMRYGATIYKGVPRDEAITHLAELWLYRSRHLRQAKIDEGYELLSYEDFCADPSAIAGAFGLEGAVDLRSDYAVQIKDYDRGEIRNMNARQVAQLSDAETGLIASILTREPELVDFFGYNTHV